MNPLAKFKVSGVTLFLAVVTVFFQIYAIVYLTPQIMELNQEMNDANREQMIKSLFMNIPFIFVFVIGINSTLVFPAHFFIKNRAVTEKKWLLVIMVLVVYFLNLYLLLAILCLSVYLWKFWQEFQVFRQTNKKGTM